MTTSKNKKLKILHLTRWDEICGIADYARDMVDGLNACEVVNEIYPIKSEFCHPTSQNLAPFYARALLADLIHIQHEFSFFGQNNLKQSIENFHYILKKLKRLEKPVIVSFHTDIQFFDTNINHLIKEEGLKKTLKYFLLSWMVKQYWKIKIACFFKKRSNFWAIAHTKKTRLSFINAGFSAEKIDVIPLGILPRNTLVLMDKLVAKEKLGYSKDTILISIFGFVIEKKGHEFAVKALQWLPKEYHLAIVGGVHPGGQSLILDEILKLVYEDPTIRDRVRVTGYVDADTRDLYHAATNICLAPYYGNTSGSAGIGWALSSGNPIIVSRTNTFNEINQEANCFLMCSQKSVFELAWLIEYLMADVNLQEKLIKNALKYAADNQWSNIAREIITCYQKGLGKLVNYTITLPNKVNYSIVVETEFPDPVNQECMKGKAYQEDAVELMLKLVNPNSKILDIGAHIGTFSLAAAANGCKVLAIEASPFHAGLIKSSAKSNQFDQLKVINAAVSDSDGFLEFFPDGPWGRVILSQDNSSLNRVTRVKASSVRDLLKEAGWKKVDFIKMDIEGYEMAALKGMSELLECSEAPSVFYESNSFGLEKYEQTPQKLKMFFEQAGYQNYLFVGGRLAPVKAEDFQASPCVDYLAIKQLPEGLSQYIRPPLYQDEIIQTVLSMCAHPLASQRALLAKALKQADTWILNHKKVKNALDRLKVDPDKNVRNEAVWWSSQSIPLADEI